MIGKFLGVASALLMTSAVYAQSYKAVPRKSVGRDNKIGGQASFSSLSYSTSGSGTSRTVTTLDVAGYYGWNKVMQEYGPRFGISNSNSSGTTVSTMWVGGFFDFNLVPNTPDTEMVYGFGGTLDLGTLSTGGNSGSTFALFAGGNLKWFPVGNNVAVRTDAGLQYRTETAGGSTLTMTGVIIRAGFDYYF